MQHIHIVMLITYIIIRCTNNKLRRIGRYYLKWLQFNCEIDFPNRIAVRLVNFELYIFFSPRTHVRAYNQNGCNSRTSFILAINVKVFLKTIRSGFF